MATELETQRLAAEGALRQLHRLMNPMRMITPLNLVALHQRSDTDLTALEMALAEAYRKLYTYHVKRGEH